MFFFLSMIFCSLWWWGSSTKLGSPLTKWDLLCSQIMMISMTILKFNIFFFLNLQNLVHSIQRFYHLFFFVVLRITTVNIWSKWMIIMENTIWKEFFFIIPLMLKRIQNSNKCTKWLWKRKKISILPSQLN